MHNAQPEIALRYPSADSIGTHRTVPHEASDKSWQMGLASSHKNSRATMHNAGAEAVGTKATAIEYGHDGTTQERKQTDHGRHSVTIYISPKSNANMNSNTAA